VTADERKEPWLNWLALTTVMLAVCATLSTFKGGSYSTRSVLSQTRAANSWAYYQAKSIKGYLYETQAEELGLELAGGRQSAAARAGMQERLAAYRERLDRYEREKAAIMAEAKGFETVRDDALKHSQTFGVAVIYLQVAILLSSVAALLRKRPVWLLGLGSGAMGAWYFVNGFFLLGR
jgi:hypothetical protein